MREIPKEEFKRLYFVLGGGIHLGWSASVRPSKERVSYGHIDNKVVWRWITPILTTMSTTIPITFFSVVIIIYLGLCGILFVNQRNLIYFPQPRSLSSGTTLILAAEGAQVLVTTRERNGPKALLYFGGNAEDVSYSLPILSNAFPDHAIYLMHYRGYGGSSGSPSEAALFSDALTLFDKVHTNHQSIVVVGRSLGSGVAVRLASLRPVARLVLVTPYDSLQELAAQQYPYFPVRWLILDKFESWRYAERITVPTLVVAAEHDEVIPRANTEALYKRFRTGVAAFKVVAGTSHNTISESTEYMRLLTGVP